MTCGAAEGPFADNLVYRFGQWLLCEFPQWLTDFLSIVALSV
ncbi:hypothetical protein SAMN04487948_1153 [Halogranum amylolyticum]|uniref:Uncharacterized protein n=1 Tax=Halogranum amylolyticum TaxID=660520 RepID=A0A1H8V9D3_9EURY|nr:hypothetical protein SAMN04487948_1153 [Halogranum amylolyticum]